MNKIVCGIDVSYKTLEIVFGKGNKYSKSKTFTNDNKGHKVLIKSLNKKKTTHVCIEATGNYHLDISLAINKVKEIKLIVLNPRISNNYAKALNQRAKTDPLDAYVLAHFAQSMNHISWQAPDKTMFAIRACGRRLTQLTKDKAKLKNRLHAFGVTEFTPQIVIDDLKSAIEYLEKQIKNLIKGALEIILNNQQAKEIHKLITSISGVADKTAIKLIGEICVLDPEMKAKQLVAHAGLYPTTVTSGTSVNKKSWLSKAGNKYIREAIYMSALQMSYRNPNVAAYYQHLIKDNGLKKMQAICAIMRKLLMSISCMIRDKTEFNETKFYKMPMTNKN